MATIDQRYGKGGASYRARIRLKGGKTLTASFKRKTDAIRWAEKTENDIREGRYLKNPSTRRKTVADLIDRYLELELPKRKRDRQKITTQLNWWRHQLGDILIKDLTAGHLAEGRDRLLASPSERNRQAKNRQESGTKGPATVIRYMASLSHALSVAVSEWEWLDTNPMHKVKRPRLPQSRVRFLSDNERASLLPAIRDSSCRYLYPVVVIALSTGARYSEIMWLRWKDIDLERGVARLEQTKNQERRALPLTHEALNEVRKLYSEAKPNSRDFLFPRSDGQGPLEIRKYWSAALLQAGIANFRFHDLRHSAASYLAMNGATLAEIAEVLGHKTLQMVKRYAHLSDQHVAKVVERMNRKIFASKDKKETSDV